MKLTALVLAGVVGFGALGEAQAMAIAPAPLSAAGDVHLIPVRGGCGYGEHRGPLGGCRLNRGPRGFIRRLRTGAPRGCPPGRTRIRGICRFVR